MLFAILNARPCDRAFFGPLGFSVCRTLKNDKRAETKISKYQNIKIARYHPPPALRTRPKIQIWELAKVPIPVFTEFWILQNHWQESQTSKYQFWYLEVSSLRRCIFRKRYIASKARSPNRKNTESYETMGRRSPNSKHQLWYFDFLAPWEFAFSDSENDRGYQPKYQNIKISKYQKIKISKYQNGNHPGGEV